MGQGRDAAIRMVARAQAAGDPCFRAPIVSPETGYIFPAFSDTKLRRVANGVISLETDEYYKSVQAAGLGRDGEFFALAITSTVNNKGVTLARFFIQRATRFVARTCYKFFFEQVLRLNAKWAPWHVHVAQRITSMVPANDWPPADAAFARATQEVQQMRDGVLVGITLDFSATLTGGVCDALVDVGFTGFTADQHALRLLFGCQAHAHRLCGRAPLSVRAHMRKLIDCYNLSEAARLRALVVELEPTRDCAGVLANPRLLPAFCPAYSAAHSVQRQAASPTTNTEESLHERVYKLCGRRQPLMVAMAGCKFVDMRDAEDMDAGRAAGAHTSVERGALSQRRQEQRRKKRDRGQRGAPDDDGGLAGVEALDAATAGSDDSTDTLIAGGGVADTRECAHLGSQATAQEAGEGYPAGGSRCEGSHS